MKVMVEKCLSLEGKKTKFFILLSLWPETVKNEKKIKNRPSIFARFSHGVPLNV
jgi:hypothetical protein